MALLSKGYYLLTKNSYAPLNVSTGQLSFGPADMNNDQVAAGTVDFVNGAILDNGMVTIIRTPPVSGGQSGAVKINNAGSVIGFDVLDQSTGESQAWIFSPNEGVKVIKNSASLSYILVNQFSDSDVVVGSYSPDGIHSFPMIIANDEALLAIDLFDIQLPNFPEIRGVNNDGAIIFGASGTSYYGVPQ